MDDDIEARLQAALERAAGPPIVPEPAERVEAVRRGISPYVAGTKERVIESAYIEILQGKELAEIAAGHGIPMITLRVWLQSADLYPHIRQLWIEHRLATADLATEQAEDAFQLSRAGQMWKSAAWYAERRDSARYGAQREPGTTINVSGDAKISSEMDPSEATRLYTEMIAGGGA